MKLRKLPWMTSVPSRSTSLTLSSLSPRRTPTSQPPSSPRQLPCHFSNQRGPRQDIQDRRRVNGLTIGSAMPLARSSDPLVWIDCEMTGLDAEKDHILQICCFITDADLQLLDSTGFETVIHQPKSTLDQMNAWCIDTHGRTGLTAAVLASSVTAESAAADLLAYIQRFVPRPRTGLLAGNSVHADKAFLARGPYAAVLEWLHYRIVDVSTIKEAARRWGSEELLASVPPKREVHLAKDDILESIEEMRFYRQQLFGGGASR